MICAYKDSDKQRQRQNDHIQNILHTLFRQKLPKVLSDFPPHTTSHLLPLSAALDRGHSIFFLKYMAEISGFQIAHFLGNYIDFFICLF